MSAPKVDLLGTLVLLESLAAYDVHGDQGSVQLELTSQLARDAKDATAACAELIAQASKPAVAYGCLCSTGIHFVSDDREDCLEESRRDGSVIVELIVRPAALAKVQP